METKKQDVSTRIKETTPPKVDELKLPENDNDPVVLSWTRPELTDDNREFFQGYNVSFSRTVLTLFSQRRKRNIQTMESQTVRVGPETTGYSYNISCPYNSSFTLCPYSRYCFSVISLFEFEGTPIDTSDPTLAMMCNDTSEAAPNGPPQEFNYTDIGIRAIGIRWNYPEIPNGIITSFTVYYNDNERQVTVCDISTLSCSTTIVGLQPYTLYSIEVSSSTAAREGPRTTPIIVRTSIAEPTAIGNLEPVAPQAISTEPIDSLEIDIPSFEDTDGPISHYFIVIINATVHDTPSTALVENDQLGPHSPTSPYYVAAVLDPNEYDPDVPFVLGNGAISIFEGIRYENVPITIGTYRYFVRAYTVAPGVFGDSQLNDFMITRAKGPEPVSNLILSVDKLFIMEESTSINIILPRFSEENGKIGYYYVTVMNVTEHSPVPPDTVSDDQLKPYNGSELFVYVVAVLTSNEYDPSQPYTLGSFTSSFFEGLTYINTPLTVGRYHCFVRAFTVGHRLPGNSELSDQFEIAITVQPTEGENCPSCSNDNSIVVTVLATLLIIALIVIVVCVIFIIVLLRKLRNSVSKHEISSSPKGGLKATEQKLPRLPSDYEEPPSIPDKNKVDPIYEDVEATAQQSKDVATGDVKMEDNPSYDTSVL